jgi:hypothetical protein
MVVVGVDRLSSKQRLMVTVSTEGLQESPEISLFFNCVLL